MAEIRIDYDLTIARANKIKSLAGNLQRVAKRIKDVEEDTYEIWKGTAANTYREQCRILENDVYDIVGEMDMLSDTIVKVADFIKRTDERIAIEAIKLETGKDYNY